MLSRKADVAYAGLLILAACGGGMSSFDRAAWAKGAGNHDGENPRAALVASAQAAGVRPGAPRAEIRALLGEPDSTGPEADIWYLGRGGYSVDYRVLRVDYDRAGIATGVKERAG